MRTVEFALYYLPARPGAGPRAKPYVSSWKMTAEEALARGAVSMVPGSAVVREMPETEAEVLHAQTNYPSAGRDKS